VSDNSIVKDNGLDIFFIERGKRRYIPDKTTLTDLSTRFGNVVKICDGVLYTLPSGRQVPNVSWSNNHDNILVKGSSSALFVMKSGEKRFLSSFDQIDPDDHDFFYPSDVRTITDNELHSYPTGPPIYKDGQVFKNYSNEVFVIDRGKRRYVPTTETFNARGFSWSSLVVIPDDWIQKIPKGRALPDINWSNNHDNVLVKGSDNRIFVLKSGQRRYIFSWDQVDTDDKDFFYPSDVRNISNQELTSIPIGAPLYFEGLLLADGNSGVVYIIEKGKKRPFLNPETFLGRACSWSSLIIIPQTELGLIPSGRVIPDVNWPNTHDNVLLQEGGSNDIWLMRNGMRGRIGSWDDIDPVDGDFYYPSDVRIITSLKDIPIQPLDLPLSLSMAKVYWASYADYQAKQLSVDYAIKNTGKNNATEVIITGSNNTKDVTTLTTLPILVGNISQEEQKVITVKYNVPNSTARFRASITATAKDSNEYVHIYP
jgi:hypothetical protein